MPSANEGKELVIEALGRRYARFAIQTHFVSLGEDYIELVRRYVVPLYQDGDILSISEKVISLCQKRIVTEEECKPGFWARFLSRFALRTEAGAGMNVPEKLQFAINLCGLPRVLWAALRSGIDKLRGVRGTFYRITGPEVAGLDGFYGHINPEYEHIGIRLPENPAAVCDEIYAATGVAAMIVDANDFERDILGHASCIALSDDELAALIKDNPAGQERQRTPFILIREVQS